MKVYIFGAGASKGSQVHTVVTESPVTNDLFNSQYADRAKEVGLSTKDLESLAKDVSGYESLEDYLTERWLNVQKLKKPWQKESEMRLFGRIALYVWNLLRAVSDTYDETNLYKVFANKLAKSEEEFGLVNFNYDILLDKALSEVFGAEFWTLDDCLNNDLNIVYLKPHGSVNWLIPKRKDDRGISEEGRFDMRVRYDLASSLIFSAPPLQVTDTKVVEVNHPDLNQLHPLVSSRFGNQHFYPLIFLPLTIKEYKFVTGFYEKIIAAGKELFSKADEVYLIGYKARDEIIKEMLKSCKEETILHVVGNGNAEKYSQEILKKIPTLVKGINLDTGFAGYLGIKDDDSGDFNFAETEEVEYDPYDKVG
ncbi:MAG: hypothetical protein WD231_02425 [Candidatus Woykebacteria bacterium]